MGKTLMIKSGEDHWAAKLTEAKVRAMRKLYWVDGLNSGCLSRLYKVNQQTIYDAMIYETWKHVKDNFKAEDVTRKEYTREDMVVNG